MQRHSMSLSGESSSGSDQQRVDVWVARGPHDSKSQEACHLPAPRPGRIPSVTASSPGTWSMLHGRGSHFVRCVGGSHAGYLEAFSQTGGVRDTPPQEQPSACPTLVMASHLTPEQQTAATAGSFKLSLQFKCSSCSATEHPALPVVSDIPAPEPPPALLGLGAMCQVLLSWAQDSATGQVSYVAVQADCDAQRWSLVHCQLPQPVTVGQQGDTSAGPCLTVWTGSRQTELASAPDATLAADQFCAVELHLTRAAYLSLRRPDTGVCVFSNLSLKASSPVGAAYVAALHSGARHGAVDGLISRDGALASCHSGASSQADKGHGGLVPVGGPLGLAVQEGRLEFRDWTVQPVASGRQRMGVGCGTGSGSPTQRSGTPTKMTGSPASSTSTSAAPATTPPGPPAVSSPAANTAREALSGLGVSNAVAAAVAVSTAGAAASRWSRKPHITDADPVLVESVMADIIRPSEHQQVTFDDIASLDRAKQVLQEAVTLPLILPELFTGIREPWKGVLLFGPPGTGKTMLAKAVACTSGATFFSSTSASLTSKWRGDSEKAVRTLFAVAQHFAPSIIFMDEIDSLVSSRDLDGEGDASRRFKAELLQQMDGLVSGGPTSRSARGSSAATRGVMVLAATNAPWDLDSALRRRLEKRLHVPLPDEHARLQLFQLHLRGISLAADVDLAHMAACTSGYSGADIKNLCRDAAMAPMRRMVAGKSVQQLKALRFSLTSSLSPTTAASPSTPVAPGGSPSHTTTPITAACSASPVNSTLALVSSRLVVRQADLLEARNNTQPSVTSAQVRRYEQWEQQFAAV